MDTKRDPLFEVEPVADEMINRGVLASIMNHVAYDAEHGPGTYRTLLASAFDKIEGEAYQTYQKELQKSEKIRLQLCLNKEGVIATFIDKYKDVTHPEIRHYIDMVIDYRDGKIKKFINS